VLRLLAQWPATPVAEGELPGPVGERNTYGRRAKGTILCVARDPAERAAQHAAAKAAGNRITDDPAAPHLVAALFAGSQEELRALNQRLAAREGPIVPVHVAPYPVEFLGAEVSLSVNTAAAGGNASLMTIG
jgi:RHH-type proline utilization regulon transcriptional repressor/proline dehydrogenase/delta 1-pyrroline-5-carboxylate dehydrogenase